MLLEMSLVFLISYIEASLEGKKTANKSDNIMILMHNNIAY